MDEFSSFAKGLSGFITGIFALAIVAIVLSNGAQTVNVLSTFFSGLTSLLTAVVAPVTGGSNAASSSLTPGASQPFTVPSITSLENSAGSPNSAISGIGNYFSSITNGAATPGGSLPFSDFNNFGGGF